MTDNNDIRVGLSFVTDQKSVADAKKATETVGGAVGTMDKNINDSAKGASLLQKELASISRAAQLDRVGKEMGDIARQTGDTGKAVADLTKKLKELGATDDEIKSVAKSFSAASEAGKGGGGGKGGGLVDRAGQIGGAAGKLRGVASLAGGGDIAGLVNDLGDAVEGAAQFGSVLKGLTAAQTAAGAAATAAGAGATGASVGFGAVVASLLPLAPILIPLAAIAVAAGAAIKGAVDEIDKRLAQLEKQLNARRSAVEAAYSGATSEDARKQIEEYNNTIQAQTFLLEENKGKREQAFADEVKFQEKALGIFGFLGDFVARLAVLFGKSEVNKYTAEVEKSETALGEATAGAEGWTNALEEGLFAANDAAEAEKKLAEERTQAVLNAASAAGQEVEARQRANRATEEQNQQRLQAIDDEREAIEAQLSVLKSSGDTSEEVAAQIAGLNQQLNGLGKESQYINNVALEASRIRDRQKKAEEDAKQAAEKAAQAQQTYTKSVESAGRTFTQAVEDIGKRAKQSAADLTKGLGRDLFDNEVKYGRDVFELQIKTQRSEIQRLKEHGRNIEDITREGFKTEEELRKGRNFLAIMDARQAQRDQYEAQQRELERGTEDAGDEYKQQRTDQKRNFDFLQADRRFANMRQQEDQRTAIQRELETAAIGKKRNLELAVNAYRTEQQQFKGHLDAMIGLRQQGNEREFALAGGGRFMGGANGAVPAPGNALSAAVARTRRANIYNNVSNMRTNNLTVNTNSDMHAVRLMKRAGY